MAGGNGRGNQLNQLYFPFSICLDDDQTIYIADWGNHRIVEWKCNATNGRIVADGNGGGYQLNYPINVIIDKKKNSFIISDPNNKRVIQLSRQDNTIDAEIIMKDIDCWGLTMDKNGSLYVSDYKKNKVRSWEGEDKNGTKVPDRKREGDHPNQLNYPTYIFVDKDDSLYVSDVGNHRVMKWLTKEGIVVAGGNGNGDSLTQLSYPRGLIVDPLGQIYVADSNNHRVMRWCKGAKEGTIVVGGNGKGQQSNQFNLPSGLSFDQQGNLYVVDRFNNRIQKFEIN